MKQKEYSYKNANIWTKQQIECYKCKRTTIGCKACSIVKYYGIKDCKLFKHILIKFTKIGQPKGV